jgi:hypothetical protein
MANEKTYNGWSNYETWVVKLWMDNEEGTYNYWQEIVQTAVDDADHDDDDWQHDITRDLSERLKDEHEEALPEVQGFAADLLNAAMGEVDWYEIAGSMVDDYLADNPIEAKEADTEAE